MNVKDVFDILPHLKKYLYSWLGLVLLLVVGLGLIVRVVHVFTSDLQIFCKACGLNNPDVCICIVRITLLAVVAFGITLFWVRIRAVPRFTADELGVLFAPNFPDELENDMKRLLVHVRSELKNQPLCNIVVKQLPPNHKVESISEANDLLYHANGITMVWGLVEQSATPEGKKVGFSKISFTIATKKGTVTQKQNIGVHMSLMGRQWQTSERNIIVDRRIMARDIALVVQNLLGLVLLTDGRYDEATSIFLPLSSSLKQLRMTDNSPALGAFHNQVRSDGALSLCLSATKEYWSYLWEDRAFSVPPDVCRKWLTNIEQAIRLDSRNHGIFLSKAIYLFLLGDVTGSFKAAKKAKEHAPSNESSHHLSLAFLYNFLGEYKKSRDEYRVGFAKDTSYNHDLVTQCLSFLHQAAAHFPDKKQLLLAVGLFELHRGDPLIAERELTKFVNEAANALNLVAFVEEGKRLLVQAKQQNNSIGIIT